MKNIVLFGGGLHANVCIDIFLKEGKYNIVGIIDSKAEVGSEMFGYPVLGRQENIIELKKKHNIEQWRGNPHFGFRRFSDYRSQRM